MSIRPSGSGWADDLSDDFDQDDMSRLINNGGSNYQATEQRAIREHEEGLGRLGDAIKRQHYMANELASEVDLHNEILDGIDTNLANANDNLRKNTRNIRLVVKKSSTFILWLLIIVLAIAIVLLAIL